MHHNIESRYDNTATIELVGNAGCNGTNKSSSVKEELKPRLAGIINPSYWLYS